MRRSASGGTRRSRVVICQNPRKRVAKVKQPGPPARGGRPRAREAITKANQALRDYSLERKKQQIMDDKTASALRTLKEAFEEQSTGLKKGVGSLNSLPALK